jgi:hypothetical protein
MGLLDSEAVKNAREQLRKQFTPYLDRTSRERLIEEARREITLAHGRSVPFAFAADKSEFVFSIRPSLASALDAARSRFDQPALLIDITAWFLDGSSYRIPWGFLCRFGADAFPNDWISEDEAADLELRLFGVVDSVKTPVSE